MVGNGRQLRWRRRVIWKSIYNPRSSRRKSSCFTRQTTSNPAHTSNLGKVSTVPYKFDKENSDHSNISSKNVEFHK